MCDLCDGTKRFSGRVEHTRWTNLEDSLDARTNGGKSEYWQEGSHMPCPRCRPECYGRVTKIEKATIHLFGN